jgi:hypothetical protein
LPQLTIARVEAGHSLLAGWASTTPCALMLQQHRTAHRTQFKTKFKSLSRDTLLAPARLLRTLFSVSDQQTLTVPSHFKFSNRILVGIGYTPLVVGSAEAKKSRKAAALKSIVQKKS